MTGMLIQYYKCN